MRVAASAVNRADLLQRQGLLPATARRFGVPGAGVQRQRSRRSATGSRAGPSGDELHRAARAAAATPSWSPYPPGSSCRCRAESTCVDAAALPEVACTVWSNVVMDAGLRPARCCSCTAAPAASARSRSRRPWRSAPAWRSRRASRREARALPRARRGDPGELPRARTSSRPCARPPAGDGADVVLDNMGAAYLAAQRRRARHGRAHPGDRHAGRHRRARSTSAGSWASAARCARPRCGRARRRRRPRSARAWRPRRGRSWSSGAISPVIDRVLPMSDAAEAHRVVEASEHVGKVAARRLRPASLVGSKITTRGQNVQLNCLDRP